MGQSNNVAHIANMGPVSWRTWLNRLIWCDWNKVGFAGPVIPNIHRINKERERKKEAKKERERNTATADSLSYQTPKTVLTKGSTI
jgi:hypothetical protein